MISQVAIIGSGAAIAFRHRLGRPVAQGQTWTLFIIKFQVSNGHKVWFSVSVHRGVLAKLDAQIVYTITEFLALGFEQEQKRLGARYFL